MPEDYYPENLMPIVSELEVRYQRFSEIREQALLGYCYNTARAYWADLDDWCIWAMERDKDVLALTETDVNQYVALLRRRKYSENTIRRRLTALRCLHRIVGSDEPGTVEWTPESGHTDDTGAHTLNTIHDHLGR